MTGGVDFSKEELDGSPVEIAPGAWVFGELHYAAGIKNTPVNNRSFAFKLKLKEDLSGVKKGSDCLFIYGLGNKGAIQGVKKLQKETGLKAVALLCNGSAHHTFLKFWYDAFPDMRIWVCPTKVPSTVNAQCLMKEYPDHWELADNTTSKHHIHQLFKYFGQGNDLQVDCVLFNQFFIYADQTTGENGFWQHPEWEPVMKGQMFVFTNVMAAMSDLSHQNTDDVMFFHKASKLLVTGHHFEFVHVPNKPGYSIDERLKNTGGFVWEVLVPKMVMSPGRYDTSVGTVVNRLQDRAIHAEQWQEVMKWDFEYATGHHDPNKVCGPIDNKAVMKGEGGLKGHIKRKLIKSGELENNPVPGSWWPWKYPNNLYKIVSAEPGFVKKFGPWQEQRFGGPGYGPDGYKKKK